MPGFVEAYKYLKNQGHEFVVITARGLTPDDDFMEEMEADAKRILNEGNIVFNKYYWKQTDKLATCKKENIDIMIDDSYEVCKKLSENGIKVIYFRDKEMKKLEQNSYIKEVSNW